MKRIHHLLILLTYLASLTACAAPKFCKCICFGNSTIIQLTGPKADPETPRSPPPPPSFDLSKNHDDKLLLPRAATPPSCRQCDKAFCLGYNLPICKDAELKDVDYDCFQRDRVEDRIIVWSFILGTAGLLSWAGIRRLLELREGHKVVDNSNNGGVFGLLGRGGGGDGGGDVARGTGLSSSSRRTAPGGSYSPLDDPRGNGGRGAG